MNPEVEMRVRRMFVSVVGAIVILGGYCGLMVAGTAADASPANDTYNVTWNFHIAAGVVTVDCKRTIRHDGTVVTRGCAHPYRFASLQKRGRYYVFHPKGDIQFVAGKLLYQRYRNDRLVLQHRVNDWAGHRARASLLVAHDGRRVRAYLTDGFVHLYDPSQPVVG